MQAANNVELRGAFMNALLRTLVNFFQRKCVSARGARIAAKRAQFAVRYANISGIDVPVDVEVGDIAMALLANVIRQPADCQQIRRPVKCDSVLGRETFLGKHLVRNRS